MSLKVVAVAGCLALSLTGEVVAQEAPAPSLLPVPGPSFKAPEPIRTLPDSVQNTPEIRAAIPSFSQLFRAVGSDFKHLPSRENAVILVLGGAVAGLSHPVERDLTEDWTRPGPADSILGPGAIIGNSFVHVGAAFALYGIGRATDNARVGQFGADLVRAQILAQSTTFAIKFAANRTRPNGDSRSFPSGHTASMFATAAVVQKHFGWKAGIPAYAAAAYVGASRIQDNKHYLSDVAFGAALGLVSGRTVTLGTRSMKFALTPVGGPGGGVGIGLTRVQ